jgi:hypothetical protein
MKQSSSMENEPSARERTWTGDSLTTGSFASYPLYYSHHQSDDTTTVSSTCCCDEDDDDGNTSKEEDPPPIPKTITPEKKRRDSALVEKELVQARQEATEAKEALRGLIEGVQIITRQLKRIDSSEDDDNVVTAVTAKDMQRLEVLMKESVDLMALNDAAQFVSQHVSMASQEASVLVQDVSEANETRRKAVDRASELEQQLQQLRLQNRKLLDQLQQQKCERKVLVKQVKLLQNENTALTQKNMQQQQQKLELHISGALQVHEKLMAQQKGRPVREQPNEDETMNVELRITETEKADDGVEAEGVVIEHSDSIKAEMADKPADTKHSALGFPFGMKSSSEELAQAQQEKTNKDRSDHSEKENSVVPCMTPKNTANYEPVKFNVVTPMSPVRPSSQRSTKDLSPTSSAHKLFFRSSNTKRSLLELNSAPMLVGRSSPKVDCTPLKSDTSLPMAASRGVSPLVSDRSDLQSANSSDDTAFRSLSLPRVTPTSSVLAASKESAEKPPVESETDVCPPEIRQIQQEIGALWEC